MAAQRVRRHFFELAPVVLAVQLLALFVYFKDGALGRNERAFLVLANVLGLLGYVVWSGRSFGAR